MPITETYQFSIINGNNKKSPRDPKVRETIIAIVENFFMENQEVMLYICETGDGKQSMRNRLFEYWIKPKTYLSLDSNNRQSSGIIHTFLPL